MAELRDEHLEVISQNKARAYEEQKQMRRELLAFVAECNAFKKQKLHSEMQKMKRVRKDIK